MKKIIDQTLKISGIEYILLSLVLVFAFLVRLYRIDYPIADWHSWRQADTASVSRTFVEKGVDLLGPKYHDISTIQTGIFNPNGYRFVEFPLFNFFHASFYKLYSAFSLEVWGRLTSIFSFMFSAVFIFLIGKILMGAWGGLWAAFFYSFIPYNIYFTRVILPEPMAVSFGLMSLYLFLKFYTRERYVYLYLSAIFFALGVLVKPFIVFYLIPMICLTIARHGIKKTLTNKHFIIASILAFFPFLLWRIWISQFPEGIPFWKWVFNDDGIRFRPAFWRWIFGERIGLMILGYWGLVPFAMGVLHKSKYWLIQLYLAGTLLYLAVVATANVRHDYYQTLIIPAIALALSHGSLFLWKSEFFNKWIAQPLLVFSLAMMFLVGIYQTRDFYNVNNWEIVAAGEAVNKLTPKDALVVAPYNGDTAFLYQTKRWGWPYVDRSIDELVEKGADYYVSVSFDDQTAELIEKYRLIEKNEKYVILDLHQKK